MEDTTMARQHRSTSVGRKRPGSEVQPPPMHGHQSPSGLKDPPVRRKVTDQLMDSGQLRALGRLMDSGQLKVFGRWMDPDQRMDPDQSKYLDQLVSSDQMTIFSRLFVIGQPSDDLFAQLENLKPSSQPKLKTRNRRRKPAPPKVSQDSPARRPVSPRLNTRAGRKYFSGPALRTFARIAKRWNLSVDEQTALLGGVPRSTFYKWKRNPDTTILPKDTLERLSHLLGIFESLQVLLPDEKIADDWVRCPNTASPFAGRSALDRMLKGQVADLIAVRRYLDTQRMGWA